MEAEMGEMNELSKGSKKPKLQKKSNVSDKDAQENENDVK